VIGGLARRLREALRRFASKGVVSERDVEELLREIQRVLIGSDVEVGLVAELSRRIKERCLKEKPLPGMTLREHVLKIVYEELVKLVGRGGEIKIKKPLKIVLLGLYGSGKTTTAAKLGLWLKKRGIEPVLVSLDKERPAAYEQLKQLGEKIGLRAEREIPDASVIVDTAGRDALNEEMLREAERIVENVKPDEVLLVIPAEMGHKAKEEAEALKHLLTGVIITRFDGSAKGGGALSACAAAGVPVKFLGTGEKLEDFEVFRPERFISRLLGWGDLESLLEKVREAEIKITKEEIEELNMITFYKQLEAMTKLGPVDKLLQMIGLTDLDRKTVDELKTKLKKYKAIIDSMTKEERRKPEIINSSRIERIARGSGTTPKDVRELLKEFFLMKKMIKRLRKGKMRGLRGFRLPPGVKL